MGERENHRKKKMISSKNKIMIFELTIKNAIIVSFGQWCRCREDKDSKWG